MCLLNIFPIQITSPLNKDHQKLYVSLLLSTMNKLGIKHFDLAKIQCREQTPRRFPYQTRKQYHSIKRYEQDLSAVKITSHISIGDVLKVTGGIFDPQGRVRLDRYKLKLYES